MSDDEPYVPTDEEVSRIVDTYVGPLNRGTFARWVAAHDAKVRAEAWDECIDAIEEHELNTEQAREGNPYHAKEENR